MYKILIIVISSCICLVSCDPCTSYRETKVNTNNPAVSGFQYFEGTMEVKSNGNNPACFLDLNTGKVYKINEAKQHAGEIDLMINSKLLYVPPRGDDNYTQYSNWDFYVSSCDAYNATNYPGQTDYTSLFQGWAKKNSTVVAYNAQFNSNMFRNIIDKQEIYDTKGNYFNIVSSKFSNLYNITLPENAQQNYSVLKKVRLPYYFETLNNGVKKRGFVLFKLTYQNINRNSSIVIYEYCIKIEN